MQYLSCVETAKLVRKSLKEAFPDVKFSVRSDASIGVNWTDGPNKEQVKAVVGIFHGAYFDGMIDYKGSISHMMDGKSVRFGNDYINFSRTNSDAALQKIFDAVCRRFPSKHNVLTVEQFRRGELLHGDNHAQYIHQEVQKSLYKRSDRLKIFPSPTRASIFVTHDDRYSSQHGAGNSFVHANL